MFARFIVSAASLAISATLLSSQLAIAAPNRASELPAGDDATVTRVIDGDTIEVRLNDKPFKLRYIGIDAPETTGNKATTCFAKEATAANKALVLGKTLRLVRDVSETDKFGRLLRYVYLPDGTLVNEALVKSGFAQAKSYPPDVKHAEQFTILQKVARDAGVGLWKSCSTQVVATPAATAQAVVQVPAADAPLPPPIPVDTPASPSTGGSATPVDAWTCPASHPIKGNIGKRGRIYHVVGDRTYNQTKPEMCFATEPDAAAAGFRAPLK